MGTMVKVTYHTNDEREAPRVLLINTDFIVCMEPVEEGKRTRIELSRGPSGLVVEEDLPALSKYIPMGFWA